MSATTAPSRPIHRSQAVGRLLAPRRPVTRRDLQVALGLLWLLDGALQAQPFMFTSGFATQVIAPVGQGQPGIVAGPVHWAATLIAGQPALWNALAAGVQLAIGLGLLVPRTARLALAASIGWALAVWYVGEGLSGLASGQASLIVGAPGSALLYAIIGAAAWPHASTARETPSRWLPLAWAAVWSGAAVFQLLPGQNTGPALAGLLTGGPAGGPRWLTQLDGSVGSWASHHSLLAVTMLVAIELFVGVGALSRRTRTFAITFGLALSIMIWVIGQDLGQLYSRQATDPNSAPLMVLMAVALLKQPRTSRGVGIALPTLSGALAQVLQRTRMYLPPSR